MPIFKTGVEIPPVQSCIRPKGTRKHTWIDDWKIGDMIELDTEKEMASIDAAVRKHGINGQPAKLTRRKIEDNGQIYYRLWRIA